MVPLGNKRRVSDQEGGKEALHIQASNWLKKVAPAKGPQKMAQENRRNGRHKVKVIGRPERLPHLAEVDFAEGQEQENQADDKADDEFEFVVRCCHW